MVLRFNKLDVTGQYCSSVFPAFWLLLCIIKNTPGYHPSQMKGGMHPPAFDHTMHALLSVDDIILFSLINNYKKQILEGKIASC